MGTFDLEAEIRGKYEAIKGVLNERARRLWTATEARAIGRGGQSIVARATGSSHKTIFLGLRELESGRAAQEPERVRKRGGGRKPLTEHDPELLAALEALVEPTMRGDPSSNLRWTCKSVRRLAEELSTQGHAVGYHKVAQLLRELGFSLQANRKTAEGTDHPDRDAQFRFINARVEEFQRKAQPVISVDTKKKELSGNFKNSGREWQPKKTPERVNIHDFADEQLGKAIPYGVYDQTDNSGWVSVGIDHDTAEFATATIERWWKEMGQQRYPQATELLITADCGGSNGHRARLWKLSLQRLADTTRLKISVSHFPPGTSKWNKIEHRMFSHITMNWRARPLQSREVVVNLIASTTTRKGLKIRADLDEATYPVGRKVSDKQLASVNLSRHQFHGDWNYSIAPKISS